MAFNTKNYFTPEGLAQLKKEYQYLVEVKRPQLVKRITRAREMGDLAENSDYHDAKDQLRLLDGKIAKLQSVLSRAVAVRKKKNPQKVVLGCQVTVKTRGKRQKLILVGELEANPRQKKISYQSPLGQLLMGKKKGETVEVEVPDGKITYQIEKIE